MPKLKEYNIINEGFASYDGYDLQEVWGLDNTGDQRFYHKGYNGHPDESAATIYSRAECDGKALYVFEGNLPGGTEIAQGEVVDILKRHYGWPEGTFLDAVGVPQCPLPHEIK